jgi:DNA replication and repair protein RecF
LKSPQPRLRELAAYDQPLVENGKQLVEIRASLVERLAPFAKDAHSQTSGKDEALNVAYVAGSAADFAEALEGSRVEEARLRQTVVGPHRDDLQISVQGISAQQYASEGQQRTVALALKLAQAQVLAAETGAAPLLLLDDIFGELDPERRNALLAHLPPASQKLVTATTTQWLDRPVEGRLFHLANKSVLIEP